MMMTVRNEKRDDGIMYAVAGMSRSGKSEWTKGQTADAQRLLVRDWRGEWGEMGCTLVRSIPELAGMLKEIGSGSARLSFFGSDFDAPDWCVLAFFWGQLWPAVIINEEVASVTNAGKATKEWGDLVRMGLYYGNHIYGVTQRPQECDKTLWGNATCKHVHMFDIDSDIAHVAKMIGADPAEVASLDYYEYLEKWAGEKELKKGKTKKITK